MWLKSWALCALTCKQQLYIFVHKTTAQGHYHARTRCGWYPRHRVSVLVNDSFALTQDHGALTSAMLVRQAAAQMLLGEFCAYKEKRHAVPFTINCACTWSMLVRSGEDICAIPWPLCGKCLNMSMFSLYAILPHSISHCPKNTRFDVPSALLSILFLHRSRNTKFEFWWAVQSASLVPNAKALHRKRFGKSFWIQKQTCGFFNGFCVWASTFLCGSVMMMTTL